MVRRTSLRLLVTNSYPVSTIDMIDGYNWHLYWLWLDLFKLYVRKPLRQKPTKSLIFSVSYKHPICHTGSDISTPSRYTFVQFSWFRALVAPGPVRSLRHNLHAQVKVTRYSQVFLRFLYCPLINKSGQSLPTGCSEKETVTSSDIH